MKTLFYTILILSLISCIKNPISVQTKNLKSTTQKGQSMLLEKIIKDIKSKAKTIDYKLPEFEKLTLDNGLQVIFIKDNLPYVHFNLRINAGQRFESRAGLSASTASLLDRGTDSLSRKKILQKLDQLGASFSARAGQEFSWVQASGLAKNGVQLMQLFWHLLSESVFKKEEWLKEKKVLLSALNNLPSSSGQFLNKVFDTYSYANTVYKEETRASVKSLTQKDLLNFYKKHYQPQSASLVVLGQYTQELKKDLIKKFSTWSVAAPVKSVKNKNTEKLNSSIVLINKADSLQADVIIAKPVNMKYNHPDSLAIKLANFSLGGGGFNSRLLDRVRKKEGLTYSIYSYVHLLKDYGNFQIHTSTNQGSLKKLLTISFSELDDFYKNGISQAELDFVKLFYSNQLFSSLERKEKLMATFLKLEGLNKDPVQHLESFVKKVEAIDLQTVNAAIKKYLNPKDMKIFVLANKNSKGGEGNIKNKGEYSILKQLQNFIKSYSSHKGISVIDYEKIDY